MSIGSGPNPYYNYPEAFGANPAAEQVKNDTIDKAKNTGIGKLTSNSSEGEKNPALTIGTSIAGIGACIGLDRGINSLNTAKLNNVKADVVQITSSGTLEAVKDNYKNTKYWTAVDGIDGFVQKNKFLKGIDDFIKNKMVAPASSRMQNLYNKGGFYTKLADKFKSGISGDVHIDGVNTKKTTKFAEFAMQQGTVQEFNGNLLENISGGLKKEIAELAKAHPGDKNVLDDILKQLTEMSSSKDPAIMKAVREGKVLDEVCKVVNNAGISSPTLKANVTKTVGKILNDSKAGIFHNKVEILKAIENKSILSKFVGKAGYVAQRALTVGGKGPMAMAMIVLNGYFIGSSIKAAIQAPKGEKLSTFMEDMLGNQIGGFLIMPFVGKLVKGVAGFRHLNTGEVKGLKKPLAWLAKLTGKIAGIGSDTTTWNAVKGATGFAKFKTGGKFFLNKFNKVGGGALRFGLIAFALTPIFTKAFTGVSHMIFGKPTKTKMEEEKAKAEKSGHGAQGAPAMDPTQMANGMPVVNPKMAQPAIDAMGNPVQQQAPHFTRPNGDNYGYVPSPAAANIKSTANDEVTKALNKSQQMEQYANNVMKNM